MRVREGEEKRVSTGSTVLFSPHTRRGLSRITPNARQATKFFSWDRAHHFMIEVGRHPGRKPG